VTAPLKAEYTAVPAEVFLQHFLAPLVSVTPWQQGVGPKMWTTNTIKPYRTVRRISGPRTADSDEPLMRVHTFGSTYTEAANEAARNDERVQVLVDYPGHGVTLPSGLVVHCDWAEISEAAHEEPYGAESVVTRFVSAYRFSLSLVRAQ
jgi:hypothetical protein